MLNRKLDVRFILVGTSIGVALLGIVFGGRDIYVKTVLLKRARAHANSAFQGEQVTTERSCVGFWRRDLSPKQQFEVYMESSNGRGAFIGWNYVAVRTSEERRYELTEAFDYYKALAYGDSDQDFWHHAKSGEDKTYDLERRLERNREHPEVTNVYRIRLVKSLSELDAVLTDLGFTNAMTADKSNARKPR